MIGTRSIRSFLLVSFVGGLNACCIFSFILRDPCKSRDFAMVRKVRLWMIIVEYIEYGENRLTPSILLLHIF